MPARQDQGDRAVSPVVGMVLVLAISVLGITGVLVWGLPAINEMKAAVEAQSIATEFHALDSDIKELAKATATNTAKLWRFSQSQGDFSVQPSTERWVMSVDGTSTKTKYNITVWSLDDSDHKVVLVNNQAIPNPGAPAAGLKVNLKADYLDGAATSPLKWKKLNAVTDTCDPTLTGELTPAVADLPWATGTPSVGGAVAFCLFDSATTPKPMTLRDKLLQIQLTNNTTPTQTVAYIWATDTGRAQWRLNTAGGLREAFVSNGVVIQGSNGALAVDGDPTITPPSKQAGTWRFFSRLTTLNGSASLGGQARIDVLLNLYASRALADELPVNATKIWTYGVLETAWDRYFLENGYGFAQVAETAVGAPANTKYLEFRPKDTSTPAKDLGMKMILHHSVVTAKG